MMEFLKAFLLTYLALWLCVIIWTPDKAGHTAHKIFNEMKIGWDQVP